MGRHIDVMDTKTNKPKALTAADHAEAADWIFDKFAVTFSDKTTKKKNIKSCISSVLTAGGTKCKANGALLKDDNRDVYHESVGAGDNGSTIFFTVDAQDQVKIVGVGHHVGAQTYDLEQTRGDWAGGANRITFDK
jgi:hypothetical protein